MRINTFLDYQITVSFNDLAGPRKESSSISMQMGRSCDTRPPCSHKQCTSEINIGVASLSTLV